MAVLAQQGDKDAFMALHNRYLAKVFNRVKSRVPPQDAEDVTPEAFVAVVRSLPNLTAETVFNSTTWQKQDDPILIQNTGGRTGLYVKS
ncbi:MAG: hypothetical protein K8L91_22845 [Anaerolineae bacterium]|nr:hypothetical protein [Anaerolineae bacterium]